MSQENKISRNLNVVKTFNDFSLDTQRLDFDYEDLADYVTENADVFYWLNIESIWGRCGFIWDVYNERGHFNNTSIKFTTLPKVPDSYRINSFYQLFKNLDGGVYTINDNSWENIDTIGNWGGSSHTFIMNMPSANFTKFNISYGSDSIYQPMVSLDNMDWSTLPNTPYSGTRTFKLKITDQNKDIVKLDVTKILSSNRMPAIQLITNSGNQDDVLSLVNIPEVFPFQYREAPDSVFNKSSTKLNKLTLYRQYVDEECTQQVCRTLFQSSVNSANASQQFYWPYPEEDNPPISAQFIQYIPSSYHTSANYINCKVLPVYSNNDSYYSKLVIPHNYDIFNNPDHKVRYANTGHEVKPGLAFYNCKTYSNKLSIKVNTDIISQMYRAPKFNVQRVTSIDWSPLVYTPIVDAMQSVQDSGEDGDFFKIVAQLCPYYTAPNGRAYSTIAACDPNITFYNEARHIMYNSITDDLHYSFGSIYQDGSKKVNYYITRVRVDEGHQLTLNCSFLPYKYIDQDFYLISGGVAVPQNTTHKIIVNDSSIDVRILLVDCSISRNPIIPNIFDFTNYNIKEGYEIQDIINFSSFAQVMFTDFPNSAPFITIDSSLDLIVKDTVYLVNKPTKSCVDLMKFFQVDYIFSYPLNRIKQVGTIKSYGHKIHLEGGYVLSLDEDATVGDAEGVEYFLSKFKFRENAQPKENSLYLNPDQYALFTQEQISLLNNNGWEVIEVIIS